MVYDVLIWKKKCSKWKVTKDKLWDIFRTSLRVGVKNELHFFRTLPKRGGRVCSNPNLYSGEGRRGQATGFKLIWSPKVGYIHFTIKVALRIHWFVNLPLVYKTEVSFFHPHLSVVSIFAPSLDCKCSPYPLITDKILSKLAHLKKNIIKLWIK